MLRCSYAIDNRGLIGVASTKAIQHECTAVLEGWVVSTTDHTPLVAAGTANHTSDAAGVRDATLLPQYRAQVGRQCRRAAECIAQPNEDKLAVLTAEAVLSIAESLLVLHGRANCYYRYSLPWQQ